MTRHKGRTGTKAIERNFPHVIEMAIPPGGSRQAAGCSARMAQSARDTKP